MDGRRSINNPSTDKPFVNHAVRESIRAGFDFLILVLLLRTVDMIKHRSTIKNYPWSTCLTVAMLYFKLRNTLNPLRDKTGLYRYLLRKKANKKRKTDSPTETAPNNLRLN
jgi:hypothetical protein